MNNTVNAVYAYDLDGNLISNSVNGTTWNYNWNAENKLIKASSSLGKSIDYTYYEDGNLGSKTSQDTTKYIYDGIHCIAKYDQDNNLINEIVYGSQIDEVLCSLDNVDTAHYYHQDALQSVTVITDGFGNKSAAYEYDVYGKIKDKTGSFKNEILYTGRWLDDDTGLYYYRARWYDADAGRFISRDPIGTEGGINLYGYVGNEPGNFVDPEGRMALMELIYYLALHSHEIWEFVSNIHDGIDFYKDERQKERHKIYNETLSMAREERSAVENIYEGCNDKCKWKASEDKCFDEKSCLEDCWEEYHANLNKYVYRYVDWLSSHDSWQ